FLPRVAEWRMSEIMDQRNGFCEILIATKGTRQRSRNLCNLDRVSEARAIMVPLMGDKHLGLVLQSAEGSGMDYPISVPLEGRTGAAFLFGIKAPARMRRT